jgi:hypothetical protein
MKKKSVFVTSLVIVFGFLIFPVVVFTVSDGETGFTSPQKGDTIGNRKNFVVSLDIDDFDKTTGHHWVAIASVTGHNNKWDRVLELYRKSKGEHNAARKEMNKLISEWRINQFWPKFFVPEESYEGNVFDGGKNPLQGLEPQPMILLIIKVDDKLQKNFRQWFRRGSEGKGYPGFPASILSGNMILARCEIFFP